MEKILVDICEYLILSTLNPRTLIQVVIQPIQDQGSILSASVNAMVLALINAGIPICSIVSSLTCCIDQEGELLVDPDNSEIENAQSVHFFTFDCKTDEIVVSDSYGSTAAEEMFVNWVVKKFNYLLEWQLKKDYYTNSI
ncbi:Exosome component 5 [Clydaea vesicula]|uniref:Exosome component 5 n=1 Tax=Clydaea vesicula TaxID=447962 RepID=A0AAD5TZH3_9FUNG|nr:Exosome component 5 [Clydaea vesicula]